MTDIPEDDELTSHEPIWDDWEHREAAKKVTASFVNRIYVQHLSDGLLRVSFGELLDDGEPTYHSAIVISARNALDLAVLLSRMAAEVFGEALPENRHPAPSPIITPTAPRTGEHGEG